MMPLIYGLDIGTSNSAIATFQDGVVQFAPVALREKDRDIWQGVGVTNSSDVRKE